MTRFVKFFLMIAFMATSYSTFAQEVKQTVAKNSIHFYKMGDNLASNKYLWRVTKDDGTDATLGTDYKFVVSYDDTNAPAEAIALAVNNADMVNAILSKTDQNSVYIMWLNDGDYYVSARVFDASSGCSDDTYNENTFGIVRVVTSNILVNLKWDVKTGDENDAEDCAVFGKNTITYTVSIQEHRAPSKLDGTATVEQLDPCKWKYKYEYNVSTSEILPEATDAGWIKAIGTDNVQGSSIVVDFDVDEYNANAKTNTSPILVEATLDPGDGQYFVWVKITEIYDGNNATYDGTNPSNVFVAKAIINQIPVRQEIISD